MRSEKQGADASGEPGERLGDSLLKAALDVFGAREPATGSPSLGSPARTAPARRPRRLDAVIVGDPLLSGSRDRRREVLAHLLATGAERRQAEGLARVLVADPDPESRWMAAEALSRWRVPAPLEVIQRALDDPEDRIRAATVRLAATRGPSALPLLVAHLAERTWPLAQSAVLEVLPGLVEEAPLSGTILRTLLSRIAAMDPPPLRAERPGLEAIARAVGTDRLRAHLVSSEPERVGAARLMLVEAGATALRAVAGMFEDPSEEVRRAAVTARHLLGHQRLIAETDVPPASGTASGQTTRVGEQIGEPDLVASLARALADPEPAIRGRAAKALAALPRAVLGSWALRALEEGPAETAASAALLVQQARIREAAEALLRRASGSASEARAPFLGALSRLRLGPPELAALLPSVDPGHRQEAVRLAWQLGGREIVPFLRPLLKDSAGPVRLAVMEVLAESGEATAVDVAEELLANDSSAAVRATAVYTLARAEPERRRAGMARALADPDPDVRATAVEAVSHGSAEGLGQFLLPALQDPDERVWRASLRHLAALAGSEPGVLWAALRESPPAKREELVRSIERSDPERLGVLAIHHVQSPEASDRVTAVELAARAGTTEGTAAVVRALSDPDPRVRRTAAVAMSTLRTPAGVGALTSSLADPHAEVRVEAVRALGLIDDDGVPPILLATLKDPEVRVREMAADSLSRWHSPAVARQIASALGSADLRRPAGDVLARMGQAAVEPLVEVAAGEDVEAAVAAGALLERIAGALAFAANLTSVDPEVRFRAVQVLGSMGGVVATDALLEALSDPETRIRSRAATLLGGMGEARAIKPLREMFLSDPVGEVAGAAEAALRLLGGVAQAGGDLRVVEDVPEDVSEAPRD